MPFACLADSIKSSASGNSSVWCAPTTFCTTNTGSMPTRFSSSSVKSVLNSATLHFLLFFATRKNCAAKIARKIGFSVFAPRAFSPLIEMQMFPKSHFRVSPIEPISIPNFSSFPEYHVETHHDENHSWFSSFRCLMHVWQIRFVRGVNCYRWYVTCLKFFRFSKLYRVVYIW